MNSLESAYYPSPFQADISILIDVTPQGTVHAPTTSIASSFAWTHGDKHIVVRDTRLGESDQWIYSLKPSLYRKNTTSLILEDSIEVSPHYLTWLLSAHAFYGADESVAGFSLQALGRRADQSTSTEDIVVDAYFHVVKYKLPGTLAFSPRSGVFWDDFVTWYEEISRSNSPKFNPRDDKSDTTSLPWFARYMKYMDMYCVFANAPNRAALAYSQHSPPPTDLASFEAVRELSTFEQGADTLTLDWDGVPVTFPLHEKFLSSVRDVQSLNNGTMPYVFVNFAYLNLTLSWICNIEYLNADHRVLFIATDSMTYNYLVGFSSRLHVAYYPVDLLNPALTKSVAYGDRQYWRFTELRLELMVRLLQMDIGLLNVEADALWLSNVLDDIMDTKFNLRLYTDGAGAGFGLMLVRPTTQLTQFFSTLLVDYHADLESGKGYGEQILFSKRLNQLVLDKDYDWLDGKKYLMGKWYAQFKDYRHIPESSVLLINNNYIVGNDLKEARARLWKHWFIDDSLTKCRTDTKSRIANYAKRPAT